MNPLQGLYPVHWPPQARRGCELCEGQLPRHANISPRAAPSTPSRDSDSQKAPGLLTQYYRAASVHANNKPRDEWDHLTVCTCAATTQSLASPYLRGHPAVGCTHITWTRVSTRQTKPRRQVAGYTKTAHGAPRNRPSQGLGFVHRDSR